MAIKMLLFKGSCLFLQLVFASPESQVNNSKHVGIDPADYVMIGDNSYYISPSGITFTGLQAQQFCNDDGWRLISFDSEEKMRTIYDYLIENGRGDREYWTSGEKWQGKWRWTGNGQLFSFTDWTTLQNEPNFVGTGEVCVKFIANWGWWDDSCTPSTNYHFICER